MDYFSHNYRPGCRREVSLRRWFLCTPSPFKWRGAAPACFFFLSFSWSELVPIDCRRAISVLKSELFDLKHPVWTRGAKQIAQPTRTQNDFVRDMTKINGRKTTLKQWKRSCEHVLCKMYPFFIHVSGFMVGGGVTMRGWHLQTRQSTNFKCVYLFCFAVFKNTNICHILHMPLGLFVLFTLLLRPTLIILTSACGRQLHYETVRGRTSKQRLTRQQHGLLICRRRHISFRGHRRRKHYRE